MADALSEMPQQVGEDSPRCGQGFDNLSTLGIADEHVRCSERYGTLRGERTRCSRFFDSLSLRSRHKDSRYLIHYDVAAYRATQSLGGLRFDTSFRQCSTPGKAATATVGTGQNSLNKVNARIFLHSKLTSHHIQQD